MTIEVHTDTNNTITIGVQATQANADISVNTNPTVVESIGTTPLFGPRGPKGDKGEKGDKGDKGETGDSYNIIGSGLIDIDRVGLDVTITSKTYIHEQGVASDTWTIEHNLNKFPSVTIVDSAGAQFEGNVNYIDKNNCIVYMNGATKGKAYLN